MCAHANRVSMSANGVEYVYRKIESGGGGNWPALSFDSALGGNKVQDWGVGQCEYSSLSLRPRLGVTRASRTAGFAWEFLPMNNV